MIRTATNFLIYYSGCEECCTCIECCKELNKVSVNKKTSNKAYNNHLDSVLGTSLGSEDYKHKLNSYYELYLKGKDECETRSCRCSKKKVKEFPITVVNIPQGCIVNDSYCTKCRSTIALFSAKCLGLDGENSISDISITHLPKHGIVSINSEKDLIYTAAACGILTDKVSIEYPFQGNVERKTFNINLIVDLPNFEITLCN